VTALLLEAHLGHALAEALNRRGIDTVHASTWQQGYWRTADDETLLAAATAAGRILVSFDGSTLPAVAYRWTAEGRPHAGLLMLSSRIHQQDIGRQLETILATLDEWAGQSWTDRVAYARRR
jgi:hypothetical protein